MMRDRLIELREIYRRELFDSVIPFWLNHSLDHVNGGQFNSLDRDRDSLRHRQVHVAAGPRPLDVRQALQRS